MNVVAYIAAVVVFVLVGLGVTVGDVSALEELAFGLALFTLGHLLPRG